MIDRTHISCFRKGIIGLFTLLCLAVASCTTVPDATSPPRRGFWLTNVDSDALFSRKGLEEVVQLA